MFNRSRRNLASWFTLVMGSILIVFAGVIYYLEAVDELEEVDRLLYKKTRAMAVNIQYQLDQGQWHVNLDNVPWIGNSPLPLDTEIAYTRWYDAQGQLVRFFGAPPPEQLTVVSKFQTLKAAKDRTWTELPTPWLRQVTLPVYQDNLLIGYLQVGTPLTSTQNELAELRLLLMATVLVDHHADFDKRNEIGETKEKPETPMPEKFIVNLNTEEREYLHQLTHKGKCPARVFKRAHILLLADEGHADETIAQMLHVGESTVHRTRQKCVDGGVKFALSEQPRPGGKRKLDGRAEAFLIATACSDAPTGQKRWTMQMLADRLVELQLVDSISDETVRRVLEKTTSSRG